MSAVTLLPSIVTPDLFRGRCSLTTRCSKGSTGPEQVRGDDVFSRRMGAMMKRVIAALALAGLATPAIAQDFDAASAESRLRGCLLAGASSAGQSDLAGKVIEVRAFCGAQIARVRDQRVAAATANLRGEEAEAAKAAATRALNDEIAHAIANFTGLTA